MNYRDQLKHVLTKIVTDEVLDKETRGKLLAAILSTFTSDMQELGCPQDTIAAMWNELMVEIVQENNLTRH